MPWFGKKKDSHTGFEGDLSEEQSDALWELKEVIQQEQITSDPRFDDNYLLRFLRYNNFKLDKTTDMFRQFIEWRVTVKADEAMVLYRFPEIMPRLRANYQHGYHKTDREGRPVWIDRPCLANIDACLDLLDEEMMMQYYVAEYEKLIHVKLPACSAEKGALVDSTFSIIDCKGFNMGLMNKKNRGFIQSATKLGQNYYPEIMWNMYVINTPFMFKVAFAMIKPFLDENAKSRIKLLGNKYQKELFKIVDPDNLPEEVGGNWTCEEHGGDCFEAQPGPWDDYPGDEFGELAYHQIAELEAAEKDSNRIETDEARPRKLKSKKSKNKKDKKEKKSKKKKSKKSKRNDDSDEEDEDTKEEDTKEEEDDDITEF